MKFQFLFKSNIKQAYLHIYEQKIYSMKRNKYEPYLWEIDLPEINGECTYKFSIGNNIRLNDPKAKAYIKLQDGEVWSRREYSDVLLDYSCEDERFKYAKLEKDKLGLFSLKVELCVKNVLHSITVLWYQSDGKIFDFQEYPFISKYNHNKEIVFLANIKSRQEGMYKVVLFLDGEQVYSDYFEVVKPREQTQIFFDKFI